MKAITNNSQSPSLKKLCEFWLEQSQKTWREHLCHQPVPAMCFTGKSGCLWGYRATWPTVECKSWFSDWFSGISLTEETHPHYQSTRGQDSFKIKKNTWTNNSCSFRLYLHKITPSLHWNLVPSDPGVRKGSYQWLPACPVKAVGGWSTGDQRHCL